MFCPFIKDECKGEECVCWRKYWVGDPKEEKSYYECCYANGWNNLSRSYFV